MSRIKVLHPARLPRSDHAGATSVSSYNRDKNVLSEMDVQCCAAFASSSSTLTAAFSLAKFSASACLSVLSCSK